MENARGRSPRRLSRDERGFRERSDASVRRAGQGSEPVIGPQCADDRWRPEDVRRCVGVAVGGTLDRAADRRIKKCQQDEDRECAGGQQTATEQETSLLAHRRAFRFGQSARGNPRRFARDADRTIRSAPRTWPHSALRPTPETRESRSASNRRTNEGNGSGAPCGVNAALFPCRDRTPTAAFAHPGDSGSSRRTLPTDRRHDAFLQRSTP